MRLNNWTVVRFPVGRWSTGGTPNSRDYEECEVYVIPAESREKATKKAQSIRSRLVKRKAELPSQKIPMCYHNPEKAV